MKGIFISHCTKNKELVEQVLELLQLGMGIENRKIFCTQINGTLPTGQDFVENIRREVQERKMVIAIITPEYRKSMFCMMELGAAWAVADYLCPILVGGVKYEDLRKTPLSNIQMRKINTKEDWYAIYDELLRQHIISTDTVQFNKTLDAFMKYLVPCQNKNNLLTSPDADGYYDIEIEKERKVPPFYKCYLIKGKLDIEEAREQIDEERHWIFYNQGVYDDLRPGDKVRLKVCKTERKHFPDVGWARNIYPDEMHAIK